MGVGLAVLDGQRGVEQEDSLLRPLAEIPVLGHSELDVLVAAEVLVDVLERGRRRHWFEHAEAKSMSLPGLVVGVLAYDDHLDACDWRHLKCVEDVLLLRINLNSRLLTFLPDSYSALTNLQMSWKILLSTNLASGFSQLCSSCLNSSKVKKRVLSIRFMLFSELNISGKGCCYKQMEVGELAKLHTKKHELKNKRDSLIQQEIKKKRREKVNLDQSAVKKGYIEKHKHIAKKKFQTVVEKSRKIPVQLQDNVNVNTFLNQSANYEKILARTKSKVVLDDQLLTESITAINAFGRQNKEFLINFTLQFEKEIECEPRSFLINIPQPQLCKELIIVLPQIKEKEDCYEFQTITHLNLKVMSNSEFAHKFHNDKIFTKRLFQQSIKCFVKFQLFKNNKFYQGLLKKGVPVFPIDSKKVPFALQEKFTTYEEYIEHMFNHYLCVTKSGKEQIFRLKTGEVSNLLENAKTIIHHLTAKLIERSKVKMNKLVKISIKTASSINMEVYQST